MVVHDAIPDTITDLPLPATLMAGIQQTGFTTLTPIQEQTLPYALDGRVS